MGPFGIGQAVTREEDPRLLVGHGRYVNDHNMPGQAHAYLLRSPHAHAEITSIDTAAAAAAPGVLAVYTGEDVAADGIGWPKMAGPLRREGGAPPFHCPHPGLARGRVRYVGDPVALVIAETVDRAKDAAELIEIGFEALPANVDTARAVEPDCPPLWDENPGNIAGEFRSGDADAVEAAFTAAAHIVRRRFVISRLHAQYMEPRGTLGYYDERERRYVLHVDVQYPHRLRNVLAEDILKVPEQDVHIIAGDVGGGFGTKGWQYVEHRLTLWAAKKLGRPVKWSCERSEALQADEHGRDNVSEAELAFDADGKILGLRVRTLANVGAYVSSVRNFLSVFGSTGLLAGVYDIPAAHVHVKAVQTNTQATAPYRGAGRPEANYVIERMMSEAARELGGALGLDAFSLRRRNLIAPDAFPYKTALTFTYDCGDFAANMDKLRGLADMDGFEARRAEAESRGRLRGLGIANSIEQAAGPGLEFCEIRFNPSGTALVLMGTKSQGQGHETMYKQIVSGRLGIEPSDIKVMDGDTDKVVFGVGTMGSRSAVMGGSAAHIAAGKVAEKAAKIAAHILEAAEADIELADGRFVVAGTDKSIPFKEVAKAAFAPPRLPPGMEPGLYETGTFRTPDYTFPNGCHACEVEIDPETGKVDVVGYSIVDDVGTVINPVTLKGQIHGGIAQGLGQVLMEQVVYDPDSGQLMTGSFQDYAMPRADDLAETRIGGNPVPTKNNPLGVKGAGEAGTCGALPAGMNAVADALRQAGIEGMDMPATPARVWAALRDGNGGA